MAVTFLTIFPFTQVSVFVTTFFTGAVATTACLSWVNFTLMVGDEKVKLTQDAPAPQATTKPAPIGKKSITCIKGKITKKVTGPNPVCPKGYRKK